MRDRAFGVEIECGFKRNLERARAYEAARQVLRDAATNKLIDSYWGGHTGMDGTLLEARSPILRGAKGFSELRTVMDLLRENGGYITEADGMHVHHDAPEFVDDIEKTFMLVRSWHDNLPLIHRFVAPRRRNSGACPRWVPENISSLEGFKNKDPRLTMDPYTRKIIADFKARGWSRNDLNISALREHGTIEIRLHEGCLDPLHAEAWIRFGQAFLNKIANLRGGEPLRRAESHESLLDALRASKVSRENLQVRVA